VESLRLALSIFTAVLVGWSILRLIAPKNTGLFSSEKLAVSYGLGLGFISLEMFIFHFFSLKFSLLSILIWWIPFIIVALFIQSRMTRALSQNGPHPAAKRLPLSGLEKFLICCISFEVAYVFFRAFIKPIEAYDAIATYAIRSKIFFLGESMLQDFFYNLSTLFPHPDYPLNIPLSETFVYLFLGNLNDQLVKVIFPLYFISILGILYCAVKRISGRTSALLAVFVLTTVPQFNNFATNAYHDVPFAYYCFAGTLFLLYWLKDMKSYGYLYISAAMTAMTAWTKNEGFVYCLANIILLGTFILMNRRNIKMKDLLSGLSYIGVILLMLAPWLWVKSAANLVNSDVGTTSLGQLNIFRNVYKIWPIFYEFQRQAFGPKKWNLIWIIFILSAIVYRRRVFTERQRYATISLLLVISGYVFAYLIGRDDIWHMVGTTWSRMAMHFLPFTVYWLALLYSGSEQER
jgi:4-amino-4-deoxy-L-arabinose transferase-like glycosyltransferase